MTDAVPTPAPIPADVPDPRFAAHLEWQLRTALRRGSRFAEPAGSGASVSRRWRFAGIAAALAGAMVVGAGGVLAAQEIRRSSAAELLARQYQVRFEIARMREEAAREDVAELMEATKQGLVSAQEFYAAEERRCALAQEASVLGLDAIEVGFTGTAPDRRLSALTVGDRDLVTERLDQQAQALQFRESGSNRRVEELERMHASGAIPAGELEQARRFAQRITAEAALVAKEKELRASFLRGEIGQARVDLEALREEARVRREQAALEEAAALEEVGRARQRAATGVVSARELRVAEHVHATRSAELRLAKLEEETIETQLADGK